jgi:hypothetical protein
MASASKAGLPFLAASDFRGLAFPREGRRDGIHRDVGYAAPSGRKRDVLHPAIMWTVRRVSAGIFFRV